MILVYYHTLLLTFRPFLIFRGHLLRQRKVAARQVNGSSNRPKEIPSWLNEACHHTLAAARKTIHHLSEASRVNDLVRVCQSTFAQCQAPLNKPVVHSNCDTMGISSEAQLLL